MRPDAPLGTCNDCGERYPTRPKGATGIRLTVLHQREGAACPGAGRPTRETREAAATLGLRRDLDAWATR